MPIIDLGKVVGNPGASMRFRGEWNSESEYFNNASYIDAVTHGGSLWICKVTNTNQAPATGTYWGIGAQGMAEDNMVFSAHSAFPSVGDENKLYIDNTVNPALIYIWNGSAYIPAGGGGEVAAEDVTYNNASSALEAQTVQEAIDENAEAISALNSRTFPDPASGTAIGEVDSYTAPSDGWLSLRLSGYNTNAQGIIECVDDNHIVGQSVYGPTGEWGILTAMLPVKKGKTYHYVITSGTFQGFYFFGNHEPAI